MRHFLLVSVTFPRVWQALLSGSGTLELVLLAGGRGFGAVFFIGAVLAVFLQIANPFPAIIKQ